MKFLWCDDNEMMSYEKTHANWIKPINYHEVISHCTEEIEDCVVSIGRRPCHLATLEAMANAGVDAIVHIHHLAETDFRKEHPSPATVEESTLVDICKENGWTLIYDDELEQYL